MTKPVLQITAYYPPHLGGVERVARALAEKLSERREVEVLTSAIGAEAGTESAAGVRVRRFRALQAAHTPIAPGIFNALIRAPRGSVWHLHCAQAVIGEQVLFAALLRREKYVFHFHLDVTVSGPFGRLLPFYKKHFFGRALRAAAAVIVLTQAQAEFVHRAYRIDPSRVHVVPNGVSPEHFHRPRRPDDEPGRALRLLYVGRLEAQKNVARLLDAMSLIQQKIELRVVGDGSLRAELEQRAAHLGLSVEFTGSLHGGELLTAYAEADAFVLPSDREGMALAALEAMASGLPVVATDVPGNRELLDGLGVLCEPEPAALARALDELAADPQLRFQVAERCASAARAYSWDVVADMVERVYDEVCA